MLSRFRIMPISAAMLVLTGLSSISQPVNSEEKKLSPALEEGKKLSFSQKKGNCLACHVIAGGDQGGNIGPPLIVMKARFPDRAELRAQIADARINVPDTIMIPFGPHEVLSEEELDKVTDFIHSL